MQLTNQQILDVFPALCTVIKASGIRARPGYKAAQLYAEIFPKYQGITAQRDRAIEAHTRKEDGKAVPQQEDGSHLVDQAACEAEIKQLLEVRNEIAAGPLTVDDLEGIQPVPLVKGMEAMSVAQVMLNLGALLVDEPAAPPAAA